MRQSAVESVPPETASTIGPGRRMRVGARVRAHGADDRWTSLGLHWWLGRGSNPRPRAYESLALATELPSREAPAHHSTVEAWQRVLAAASSERGTPFGQHGCFGLPHCTVAHGGQDVVDRSSCRRAQRHAVIRFQRRRSRGEYAQLPAMLHQFTPFGPVKCPSASRASWRGIRCSSHACTRDEPRDTRPSSALCSRGCRA